MATKADIKSATITYMKLSKTDTKYKITAQWDIELTTGIAEKLYMMVFHQSGTKYTKEISLDATDGEIEFTPAVEDDTYKFTISDRPTTYNKDICTPVSVLFRTYENVSGEYDGDMVQLKWDKPNKEIVVGESLVKTLPDDYTVPVIGGKIERYYRETSFKVSGQNYNDGSAFQIELEPAKSTVSCGITVRSGLFFHKPVEIHIVNIDDVSDGLEITATFKTAYLGSTWKTYVDSGEIMIQPVLWLNDGSLLNGTKTALKDLMETEDTATHKFTVTDKVWVKNINSCDDIKMTLNLCTSTTRTVIRTRENTMLLTRPSVRFAYTDKNAITVSWDYQRNDNFTVKVDSKSYTSTDKSLDIKDITLSTLLDSDITVEPHKTPKSCAIKLFKSGFYPSASGVEYFENAYTGDNLNIKLGADFFETDPSAKLMEGPFTIEDGVFSYDKSIQFTKEHFSKWLELLDENSISPSGYYEMRRIVSSILYWSSFFVTHCSINN